MMDACFLIVAYKRNFEVSSPELEDAIAIAKWFLCDSQKTQMYLTTEIWSYTVQSGRERYRKLEGGGMHNLADFLV